MDNERFRMLLILMLGVLAVFALLLASVYVLLGHDVPIWLAGAIGTLLGSIIACVPPASGNGGKR